MEEIAAVRLSPLHAVVFACIFQDRKKAGPAMLEFLNAILVEVGEEPIAEIIDMKSEYSLPISSNSGGWAGSSRWASPPKSGTGWPAWSARPPNTSPTWTCPPGTPGSARR